MDAQLTTWVTTPLGKFRVPSFSSGMLRKLQRTGGFELSKLRMFFLWSKLHTGDDPGIFVDVGANIGTTCIPATHSPLVTGCIAVEPAPFVRQCLEDSIDASNVKDRVKAVNVACGDSDGVTDLLLSPINCGDNRFAHPVNGHLDWQSVEVPVRTLDSILGDVIPRFVWIDAQGAEASILAGTKLVREPATNFFIEFFPPGLQEPLRLFKILEDNWTQYIDVNDRVVRPIRDVRKLYARMMGTRNLGAHTDLFLIH